MTSQAQIMKKLNQVENIHEHPGIPDAKIRCADEPIVLAADIADLWEGSLADDGSDILRLVLAQVNEDVTQRSRRLSGQVGAGVVIGQHLHHFRQHLLNFRLTYKTNSK